MIDAIQRAATRGVKKGVSDRPAAGEPILSVWVDQNGKALFALRSPFDTMLMSGGPLPVEGELRATVQWLQKRLTHKGALQVDTSHPGIRVTLCNQQKRPIGATPLMQNEDRAPDLIDLIASLARRATVRIDRDEPS